MEHSLHTHRGPYSELEGDTDTETVYRAYRPQEPLLDAAMDHGHAELEASSGPPLIGSANQYQPQYPSQQQQERYRQPIPTIREPYDARPPKQYDPEQSQDPFVRDQASSKRISKEWQRRLYWMVPLGIVAVTLVILFEVYKTNIETWLSPLSDWLRARESWSWAIPVGILVVLSFPPLFGHEIVQLIVGLAYPLGVAIGIAIAGAIIGEAGCFIAFKYGFSGYVEKKIRMKINWAATARVAQQAGFRGVLLIRYSIVPPHLANPLFSCTGMAFWLYMVTVILSLPKTIIFVILGSPGNKSSKTNQLAKIAAVGVIVLITIFASWWIRKKMQVATREIEAERAMDQEATELDIWSSSVHVGAGDDTSYQGVATTDFPSKKS